MEECPAHPPACMAAASAPASLRHSLAVDQDFDDDDGGGGGVVVAVVVVAAVVVVVVADALAPEYKRRLPHSIDDEIECW